MRKLIIFLLLLPIFANSITPVYSCGFECGVSASSSHISGNGTSSYSTTTVRSGARSGRCNPSNQQQSFSIGNTLITSNVWVFRVYVRWASLPTSDCMVVINGALGSSDDDPGVYFKQSDSKLYCAASTTGTVTFASTGVSVTTGTWYRIDLYINTSANPWTIDAKVDGTSLAQHTVSATATSPNTCALGTTFNETFDAFYDDLMISTTSGDYPIGGGYVNHFIPTSDGTHNVAGANDFERSATGTDITNATTTAFQLVDDVPLKSGVAAEYINLIAPPNATDYVELVYGAASGISTPTNPPRYVTAVFGIANSASGTNNIRLALNDNGTTDDVFNGNGATTGTTIIYKYKGYADPPSAASTWTLSGNGNFNNIRMRVYTSDAAPDPWLASAMIEAEFQEISAIPRRVTIISKR